MNFLEISIQQISEYANITDAVIFIIFIIGILNGIRKGAIKSVVGLVGIVIVVILSFELKNPIAKILYSNLPFLNFKIFKAVQVFNILFYEIIAFVIVFSILMLLLRIVLKLTGIVQKVLDATIVLGIGNRLLGAVISLIETYVIVYVILFLLNQPFFSIVEVNKSKVGNFILNKTPIIANVLDKNLTAYDELFKLKDIYENTSDINEYNYKSLDILLKYGIVDVESIKTLQSKNKLDFKNINEVVIKYGG